ncbi:MAG TPA: hypothetical protein VKY74_23900 [Chloroflexia bacterium]|nr:hypothetical protein [Chloroflexia bacterium]
MFPEDDYTPHGYLQNRFDAGPFPGLEAGGPIRSLPGAGFAWQPAGAPHGGLLIGAQVGEILLLTDLDAAGLVAPYHSAHLQRLQFSHESVNIYVEFWLAAREVLGCRIDVYRPAGRYQPPPVRLVVLAVTHWPGAPHGWCYASGRYSAAQGSLAVSLERGPWYQLWASERAVTQGFGGDLAAVGPWLAAGAPPQETRFFNFRRVPALFWGALVLPLHFVKTSAHAWAMVERSPLPFSRAERLGVRDLKLSRDALWREDRRFWQGAPQLGRQDWPAHWRRGVVYDTETSRLLVAPPAGIFPGPYPVWMAEWPRAVLAEGTLDMSRLAYADPGAAQAAVATLFAAAPGPQVPCVWANGGYNMIAADGAPCGTSPAWCLPFHNLWLLWLRHPDSAWLATIYPRLVAYVRWWLAERTDSAGWVVYQCTWESGEDNTPRLDPSRTGDAVIRDLVRPVELQAALAVCAEVLRRFAAALGRADDAGEWAALYAHYRDRTRQLWDPATARFRDLDPATGRWREVPDSSPYWGSAAGAQISPLQLLPLLYGIATAEQVAALRPHLAGYVAAPWTWWPSWSYHVAEAALAAGAPEVAADLAAAIVDRVYRQLDRRERDDGQPLPGVAPEFWPEAAPDGALLWTPAEAYGWGASAVLYLLRYLVGFQEGEDISRQQFTLRPALPPALRQAGLAYTVRNLGIRGARIDLTYCPGPAGDLEIILHRQEAGAVRVAEQVLAGPGQDARFPARWGQVYDVVLEDGAGEKRAV